MKSKQLLRDSFELIKEKCYGHLINWVIKFQKVIKTVGVSDWVALSIQIASFYSFHLKTVRS